MKIGKESILQRANEILGECYELVTGFDNVLDLIRFRVSARMTRAAGTARPSTGEITLSLAYFEDQSNFEKEFRNVVTHEIAHVLSPPTRDSWTGRRSSHGPAWKAMHRRLGGTGDRCHELSLAVGYQNRARAARVEVPCPKCNKPMSLGPIQLKKYRRGATYSHAKCP